MKKLLLLIFLAFDFSDATALRIEYGNNIIINQPVHEDLYITGGTVTINAPIFGDLIIAGGTIVINDTVTNDILLMGGSVNFNGIVGDDIRCLGGNLTISKNVSGDVVIAGGSVSIESTATIGGLLISGGDVTINSDIDGEIKSQFGNLILNGKVTKNIDCRGGKLTINGTVGGDAILAANTIIIGNNAAFNQKVRYWNKKESLDFKQSLKNEKAVFDASLHLYTSKWYYLGASTIMGLLWYLGMALLLILLIQYLFSNTMKRAANTVFENTLKSLGYGFAFLIAIPVIIILAFVTIIGVPVGLVLLISYITLLLLASIITSVVAANWLNSRNNYKWNFWRIAVVAFFTFIILKIVTATPIAGWIILPLLVCISFGAILLNINWKSKRKLLVMNQNS